MIDHPQHNWQYVPEIKLLALDNAARFICPCGALKTVVIYHDNSEIYQLQPNKETEQQ